MAVMPDLQDIGQTEFECLKFKRCRKFTESEHQTQFIPVKELCHQHVCPYVSPVECEMFFRFIKSFALRTVKILRRLTSKDRPKMFLGTNTPGSTVQNFGTGFVMSLSDYLTRQVFIPGQTFFIKTAAHVIYNTEEAQRATVEFFFDDDIDCSHVIVARGVRVSYVDEMSDVCQFMCQVESVSVGDEVTQRMNQISCPSIPSTLQPGVTFCVSHPHGVSQRVSIGYVTSMVVKKIEETGAGKQLLLLVSRCLCDVRIEEKKVWFILFRDYSLKTQYHLPYMSDKDKSESIDLIISHLETKSLIKRPTDKEVVYLHFYIDALTDTLNGETDDRFKAKYGSKTFSAGDKKVKWNEIFDEIIVEYSKTVDITDDLIDRYRTIISENDRKMHERTIGQQRDLHRIETLSYSTPTCPGSSGAMINAFATVIDKDCKHLSGPHSRTGKGGNICSGGLALV